MSSAQHVVGHASEHASAWPVHQLLTLLRCCPMAHRTWLSLVAPNVAPQRLPPATFVRLDADGPSQHFESTVLRLVLEGMPGDRTGAQAVVAYGDELTIAIESVEEATETEADDGSRRLGWCILVEELVALSDSNRGLVTPAERELVAELAATVGALLDDDADAAMQPTAPAGPDVPVHADRRGGELAAILAAVLGGLAFDLLVQAVGADALRQEPVYVLAVMLVAAVPAAVVMLLVRHPWTRPWVAGVGAGLAVLDGAWRLRRLGDGAAVATGAAAAAAVTVIVLTVAPGTSPTRSLEGGWRTDAFAVLESRNFVDQEAWSSERWRVTSIRCESSACSYRVDSPDEEDFVLRPRGESWVGHRTGVGDCARSEPPHRVTVPDGYDHDETIRVVPTGRSDVVIVYRDVTGTATEAALAADCDPKTFARLRAVAQRR